MTEIVTSRESTSMPLGHDQGRCRAVLPVRRYALGVATCLVLAASLLAGCGGSEETCTGCTLGVDVLNADRITVGKHLYLKAPDGTKFEIGVGNDASGKDVLSATPAK